MMSALNNICYHQSLKPLGDVRFFRRGNYDTQSTVTTGALRFHSPQKSQQLRYSSDCFDTRKDTMEDVHGKVVTVLAHECWTDN